MQQRFRGVTSASGVPATNPRKIEGWVAASGDKMSGEGQSVPSSEAPMIYRAWINQPSEHQPLHKLHSSCCIVEDNGGQIVRLWFCYGHVHSMEADRLCITRVNI
jgi:hypothetical protein